MKAYVVMHGDDWSELELPVLVFLNKKDADKYVNSMPSIGEDGACQYYSVRETEFVT